MMIRVNEKMWIRADLITKIEVTPANYVIIYTGKTWVATQFETQDEAVADMNRLVSEITCIEEARDQCLFE